MSSKKRRATSGKKAKRAPRAAKQETKRAVKPIAAKKGAGKKASAKRALPKGSVKKAAPAKKAAAKKPAKKMTTVTRSKASASKKKPAAARKRVLRRDAGGHIDAAYAKDLLKRSGPRSDEGRAFIEGSRSRDDLAEELAEQVVETATSGEDESEDVANQEVSEERGGPFVVTTGGTEFADGVDESNPKGAKREPFPTT